jgi:hypothetical protein
MCEQNKLPEGSIPYFATRCDPWRIIIPASEKISLADLKNLFPEGVQMNLTTVDGVVIFADNAEDALKKINKFFQADKWNLRYEGSTIYLY